MALCSLAFASSAKRTCDFSSRPANKRTCLTNIELKKNSTSLPQFTQACYSSSSDSASESDDQSCYKADQIRAKRRASSRVSFCLNNELSKAVAQYSDYEDDLFESRDNAALQAVDENLDCKLLSSPGTSSVYVHNNNGNLHMAHHRNSSASFLQISDTNSSCAGTKKCIPDADKNSRARCFDYLVGAIDEAWARYCDAASYVEDETYGYNTPGSVATDDEDFGNSTDLTDYDSEFEHVSKPAFRRKPSLIHPNVISAASPDSGMSSTDKDPSSCKLQALKDRLTKAKYFLQDLVDSDDYSDASDFWKRWDMIKYATIELVEDDDDDDVIEATIDDLEDGRLFTN